MKFFLSLSLKIKIIIAACAVAAAVAVTVIVMNTEDAYRVIKVFELNGSAVVTRKNTGDIEAYEGMNLESGDVISVGVGSTLRISLDSDKYILLDGGTVMRLIAQGTAADSRTVIDLEEGTILNEIRNSLSANSSYEVNTPKATMAVRGTVFKVSTVMDEEGNYITVVETTEGRVVVRLFDENGEPRDEEMEIPAGKGITIFTEANSVTGNPAGIDGVAYYVFADEEGGFSSCSGREAVYSLNGSSSEETGSETTAGISSVSETEISGSTEAETQAVTSETSAQAVMAAEYPSDATGGTSSAAAGTATAAPGSATTTSTTPGTTQTTLGTIQTTSGTTQTTSGTIQTTSGTTQTTSGTTQTTPGTTQTTSGTIQTTPGTTQTTPGTTQTTPGTIQTTPGTTQTTPGTIQTTPGTIHTTPGTIPTAPGTIPTAPGTIPTAPGTTPTTPGTTITVPNVTTTPEVTTVTTVTVPTVTTEPEETTASEGTTVSEETSVSEETTVSEETSVSETETTPPVVYRVSFFDENGNAISDSEIEENEPIGTLPLLTDRKGYSSRWVSGGEEVTEATVIEGDMTVTAEYTALPVTVQVYVSIYNQPSILPRSVLSFAVDYDDVMTSNNGSYTTDSLAAYIQSNYTDYFAAAGAETYTYRLNSVTFGDGDKGTVSDSSVITGDRVAGSGTALTSSIYFSYEIINGTTSL